MGFLNHPVSQIFLIGPKEKGMHLARKLFTVCVERNWVPAIFVSDHLTEGIKKQITYPIPNNGVITFGEESKQVYEEMCRSEVPVKVLRILEPGEPKPERIFSYQRQVWEDAEDVALIASWMGIVQWMSDTYFCIGKPGALTEKELYPQSVSDELISVTS